MIKNNINEFEKPLINWLLNSGVLIKNSNKKLNGGVYAGYDLSNKEWQFIYCEITGYSISTFCMLYTKYKKKKFLDYAFENANFLIKHQINDVNLPNFGSFPEGLDSKTFKTRNRHYTFDAAMCIQGLLDLYSIKKDVKLLQSALKAGNWLLKMQNSSGSFLAYYDSLTKEILHPGPYFYLDESCLHAKNAIALIKLYQFTNEDKFKNAAIKLCDWVLELQEKDGSFWANNYKSHVYTHAHCYATEGLIYAESILKIKRYDQSVMKACQWLKDNIHNKTNTIIGSHKISKKFNSVEKNSTRFIFNLIRKFIPRKEIAIDATMQSARLLIYKSLNDPNSEYFQVANELIESVILKSNYNGNDNFAIGSLHSRIDISFGNLRKTSIVATWAVMFSLQTCILRNEVLTNKNELTKIDFLF